MSQQHRPGRMDRAPIAKRRRCLATAPLGNQPNCCRDERGERVNKNPEAVSICFPRPEVRFRPLPTCGRRMLAHATYDLNLGSGLASNRKNLPTPRDSILFLTCFLFSQPAVRYRPSLSLRLPMRCRRGCGELASAPDSSPTGKPWKLSKNECVVHPADFPSTVFSGFLSSLFSMKCSSSTGG